MKKLPFTWLGNAPSPVRAFFSVFFIALAATIKGLFIKNEKANEGIVCFWYKRKSCSFPPRTYNMQLCTNTWIIKHNYLYIIMDHCMTIIPLKFLFLLALLLFLSSFVSSASSLISPLPSKTSSGASIAASETATGAIYTEGRIHCK